MAGGEYSNFIKGKMHSLRFRGARFHIYDRTGVSEETKSTAVTKRVLLVGINNFGHFRRIGGGK